MPYKSGAQRRWAHTPAGTKALGGKKNVEEWDGSSRGQHVPEHVGDRKRFHGFVKDFVNSRKGK